MHQLSLPPTPTRNTIIGLTPSTEEENKPTENITPQHPSSSSGYASSSSSSQPDSSTEDGLGVSTRRGRSNSLARRPNSRGRPRSYSYSVNGSQQSVRSFTEQESNSEASVMKDASSEAVSNPIPEVQEEKEDTKDGRSSSSRLERGGGGGGGGGGGRGRGRGGGGGGGGEGGRGGDTGNVDSQVSSKPSGSDCRTRPRRLKIGSDKSPTGGATLNTAPALYTGRGDNRVPRVSPSKLSSTRSLTSNTSSPLVESPSEKAEDEGEEGEVLKEELINETSRKSFPERNLLVPHKNQDLKSGIANVRESFLVDNQPRLRRGKTGSQSAVNDPHKRRSLIETTSLRSFASQEQYDALTTWQRKDFTQDDINLSTSTSEPVTLPDGKETLQLPLKQSLSSRGTALSVLTEPITTQMSCDQSDQSPRSVAAVTRNYSDSVLVPSRFSSSTDQQGNAAEQQTNSANLPRRIKHTVAYRESSARAKKGNNAPTSYCTVTGILVLKILVHWIFMHHSLQYVIFTSAVARSQMVKAWCLQLGLG